MDHSQIIKYFDEYIKKYSPYSNNTVYHSLIDYLSKNFTKELYKNIPNNFKQLYEENSIPIDKYDIFLQRLGVPKKILNKLQINDKITFYKNFTDFYRYRGNIYFFEKISNLFNFNTFNIYELYIDYDNTLNDWVFKPNLIVKNINEILTDQYFEFDEIYNNIPSFLINKTQLTSIKNDNNIILPIKSNIVLLNYLFTYDIKEINNLINAIFLKEYKNNLFTCYFLDSQFNISLNTFFILWYYLFLKLYNSTISNNSSLFWAINYSILNSYSLLDIENIYTQYNNINNAYDARVFYNNYISSIFLTYSSYPEYTKTDLEIYLSTDIIDYIDNRLDNAINLNSEYNNIFNEMLNSLNRYFSTINDPLFLKFSDIFINSLTQFLIDPKDTSSFTLLNHYKPYHTELLTDYNYYLTFNSKFDIVTPHDESINFKIVKEWIDNNILIEYMNFNLKFNDTNILNITEDVIITHLLPDIQYNIHNISDLELYCNYSNYEIFYTIDGNDPTIEDNLYTGYINIDITPDIKAIAYNSLDESYSNILNLNF